MFEAFVIANILDPNHGVTQHKMVIGEQIDQDVVTRFSEDGQIYVMVAYEHGIPQHTICKKDLWLQAKQHMIGLM
jgi:hypothetical protein